MLDISKYPELFWEGVELFYKSNNGSKKKVDFSDVNTLVEAGILIGEERTLNLIRIAKKEIEELKKEIEVLTEELNESRNVSRQLNDWLTCGSPDDKALNIKREEK